MNSQLFSDEPRQFGQHVPGPLPPRLFLPCSHPPMELEVAVTAPQEPPTSGPVFFSVTVCLRVDFGVCHWSVVRRYSEFDALKTALQQQGLVLTVELPRKFPPPGYNIAALNKRRWQVSNLATLLLPSCSLLRSPASAFRHNECELSLVKVPWALRSGLRPF